MANVSSYFYLSGWLVKKEAEKSIIKKWGPLGSAQLVTYSFPTSD